MPVIRVIHTSKTPKYYGELISESWLTEDLKEIIRYSPEFKWTTATKGRQWGMHILKCPDVKVTKFDSLPFNVQNILLELDK